MNEVHYRRRHLQRSDGRRAGACGERVDGVGGLARRNGFFDDSDLRLVENDQMLAPVAGDDQGPSALIDLQGLYDGETASPVERGDAVLKAELFRRDRGKSDH